MLIEFLKFHDEFGPGMRAQLPDDSALLLIEAGKAILAPEDKVPEAKPAKKVVVPKATKKKVK